MQCFRIFCARWEEKMVVVDEEMQLKLLEKQSFWGKRILLRQGNLYLFWASWCWKELDPILHSLLTFQIFLKKMSRRGRSVVRNFLTLVLMLGTVSEWHVLRLFKKYHGSKKHEIRTARNIVRMTEWADGRCFVSTLFQLWTDEQLNGCPYYVKLWKEKLQK